MWRCMLALNTLQHTKNGFIFNAIASFSPSSDLLFKAFCFISLQLLHVVENLWKCLVCFDPLPVFSGKKQPIFTLITWKKKKTLTTHTGQEKRTRKQIKEKHYFLVLPVLVSALQRHYTLLHSVQTEAMSAVEVLSFLLKTLSPFPHQVSITSV